MTVNLSEHVMQAMGFSKLVKAEEISATFESLTVYEIQGVLLAPGFTEVSSGKAADVDYRLAVSASVNEACIALLADVFIDDEVAWKGERKCAGPFVLVQLGPTDEHKSITGRFKTDEDGSITTYNCFPSARTELVHLEAQALPPIISALTCVLNEDARYVTLQKIERASVGRTNNGVVVHDIRVESRMELSTAYKLVNPHLSGKLELARNLTSVIDPKASRFFSLGLAEEDELKRFLFFFFVLEVETHRVYKGIDRAAAMKKLLNEAPVYYQAPAELRQTEVDGTNSLLDRFVWCTACVWSKLGESDIQQFKALKKARNDIAHGSISAPPLEYARQVEHLAHRVLWSANSMATVARATNHAEASAGIQA